MGLRIAIIRPGLHVQAALRASHAARSVIILVPTQQRLLTRRAGPPAPTFVNLTAQAYYRRLSSTPSRLATPPASEAKEPTPTPSTPLSLSERSHLVSISTRRQLRALQLELELLRQRIPPTSRSSTILLSILVALTTILATYQFSGDFRRVVLAAKRSANVGWAVIGCIIDYKALFRKTWAEDEEGRMIRHLDYENCHRKCAERVRDVLKKNGGIYIKLGQHLSSIQLIPTAWSSTMKPLQDQCFPTALEDLKELFLSDVGAPLSTFFSTFDPIPIGVASLAQVHLATDRGSGRKVAVKIMHPDLEEFCAVDMKTTVILLKLVKRIFPTFEFTWLGEEMELNLPLEMDFRHEAANASRCAADFAVLKSTTIVIPEVLWAKRRVMVMEFIDGSRIDDMQYLADHNIDRNQVAQQLSHLFSRMIYITGFFHADPHGGNLLIRPSQPHTRSPYNFEIVLLDHGLYFDYPEDLRIAYANLWLSLISPSSPAVEAARRKYAYLAGNIDESLYPLFQAAITGRVALASGTGDGEENGGSRAGSMMELGVLTKEESHKLRSAMVQEGLMLQIFDLLRRVPRRMLMVLKVNDLTRALDASLHTTHGPSRHFLIVAQYCNLAVYRASHATLRHLYLTSGVSLALIREWVGSWWKYQVWKRSLGAAEVWADGKAALERRIRWWKGFYQEGFERARQEAAGLRD